ncbi:hypothetical protein [Gordonia aichiensis]|uniref:Uncharacterized protein n=1 Tax=Gordonia aichiensis NBRC 108223 TaxID=1220583 RepID=L7KQ69_9ACTN|nr:hypothetical protein [Gordonia aichiensis]GAC50097.1 hypothetical protein GOACH_19_01020 [Gordonia aichiensis NBRC 108223]
MRVDPTVGVASVGLIGGYATARYTGQRPLGGVVLGLAGAWCTKQWLRRGPGPAAGLLAGYLAAFGLSHPLAKKIGAWRSVFAVTGAFGAATYAVTSRTSEN